MSSHPYGLRGDPFASPATLSAKDASRLIRRRVRAFNGDGGVLFPIDTCDLIHEITGGVPDAMLALAGHAMRIADAEGAPAVMPPHVRQAAGSAPTTESAPTEETAAGARDDADEGVEQEAFAPEAAATDEVVTTRSEIPTRAQISARAQAVLAWEEEPAIADDDPDLPAFHPAAFALPNEPSEKLDTDARDWVSRFIIPSPGVSHRPDAFTHAAHAHAARPAAGGPQVRRSVPAPVSDGDAVESALAAAYGHAAPRRKALPRGPRRRRRSGNQGLLIAVAAVCAVAFIIRMSVRGNLLPPGSETQRPVQTATRPADPADDPQASAPEAPRAEPTSKVTAERETAPAIVPPAATVIDEPLIGPHSAAQQQLSSSATLTTSGTPPESAVPVRRDYGKFGLEVATFIFEERARVERDRLVANGLKARLVTTVEYGSRVYRVVVGGFPHPAAAERAADSLLSNGVVLQARVIRNP
jgi:sporulation related protein